ncbi:MAG: hypothetical protein M1540_01810 [Candidatus Bathyarchaeota archaeon]|nr:hypothetical protein [Chloroflexota bacterium]MCL5876532.1 hypothetical protein [Candidatus Bathyarchaeota archaeon]
MNAKLEEQKKDNNQVTLGFQLLISTKPNVVKYSTSGTVVLTGKAEDVKKKLEVNPKTKIPQILFTIYQHVFNSIYMLSSNLNTPYPPPDLLHPMAEKIQILSNNTANQAPAEKTEAQPAAVPAASAQPQTQPAAQAQPAATAAPAQPQAQATATSAPAASSQPEAAPK